MRTIILMTAVAALSVGQTAGASDLNVVCEAAGCESPTVTTGPGCEVRYRVLGELNDAASRGLAVVVFDLEFDGGLLTPADTPAELPMSNFAPPAGYGNPNGFGGTPFDGRLVQVGGAQNIVNHGNWACATDDDCPGESICADAVCAPIAGLPVGTVITDVAQPGSPVVLATGSLSAPLSEGVYSLNVTNLKVNVLARDGSGKRFWWTEAAHSGVVTQLTITVEAGAVCCSVYEACCTPDGACTASEPTVCTSQLNGLPQGEGSLCAGDLDGDGVDGTCGDECPNDQNKLEPGSCGCGNPETDSDGDGSPDCIDGCKNDSGKIVPGICGCGVPDVDTDGDEVYDCDDLCPQDPLKTEPGMCGCGASDGDSDADGVRDCDDVCPGIDDAVFAPNCTDVIPTLSTWGVVVFSLLLLIAGKLHFRRRPSYPGTD